MPRVRNTPATALLFSALGVFLLLCGIAAWAQMAGQSREFQVAPDGRWLDTKIELQPGDRARITSSGTLKYEDARQENGPEGLPRAWRDLIRRLPLPGAGRGALLGRVGDDEVAQPFLIGASLDLTAQRSGRLFLAVNHDGSFGVQGRFAARVEILERAPATDLPGSANAPAADPIPGVDAALFEKIPRRVEDHHGTPGDMVNFLILGPESEVRRAIQQAGWVLVNRTKKDAVLGAVLATLSKKAYVELPMSELLLFGRPQDFGFAQGEPYAVIAERHHFRLWRAPFDVNAEPAWIGAGTHDVGFDRDQRTGGVTHRIDPQVDRERDYIGRSLAATGLLAQMSYLTPREPLRSARTAHGQEFASDGRVLAMRLRGAGSDLSRDFAALFCSVLAAQDAARQWGDCAQYIESPAAARHALGPLSDEFRVLIVPGVMNNCASSAPAFAEGQKLLREKYGLTVELFAVPNDSSEANARRISEYLAGRARTDRRPYIIIGYSKGGPDVQTALALDPDARKHTAAFVSVAGAIGGSPIADLMPAHAERYMKSLKLGGCEGDLKAAFASLRRDVRQAFARSYPSLPVPTYTLAAQADPGNVSKILQQTWQILSAYDRRQDAQLTFSDQFLPGSRLLGAVRADHFAVALPFDASQDAQIRQLADRNRFPRAALLEAIVRFVSRDISPRLQ
jgi:hypothetical protein